MSAINMPIGEEKQVTTSANTTTTNLEAELGEFDYNNLVNNFETVADSVESNQNPNLGYLSFKETETVQIRIFSTPQFGFEYYSQTDGKPRRSKTPFENYDDIKPSPYTTDGKPQIAKPKAIMVFKCYNKTTGKIEIANFGQKSVIKGINAIITDIENYGDPRFFDIKISKPKETKSDYTVMPIPPKQLTQEEKEKILENIKKIDLEKWWNGENPFIN